jgi:hypothetical protein
MFGAGLFDFADQVVGEDGFDFSVNVEFDDCGVGRRCWWRCGRGLRVKRCGTDERKCGECARKQQEATNRQEEHFVSHYSNRSGLRRNVPVGFGAECSVRLRLETDGRRHARQASRQAKRRPFDPALRALRLNCAAAQFTSSPIPEWAGLASVGGDGCAGGEARRFRLSDGQAKREPSSPPSSG